MKLLYAYFIKNWIIYSLLMIYLVLLVLNTFGLNIWLPECIITQFSGHTCLGCGLNRAAIQLLQLDFRGAFLLNPLIYLYVPIISAWISFDFHKFRGKRKQPENEQS